VQVRNYSFLDPHGLYWACNVVRGKRAMKEKIKECLRVILSKNLESLACISTFELGSTTFVLYINPYCTFCAFLVKSGDLLSLFFLHSPLADFALFFLSLLPNFMHVFFALLFPPV